MLALILSALVLFISYAIPKTEEPVKYLIKDPNTITELGQEMVQAAVQLGFLEPDAKIRPVNGIIEFNKHHTIWQLHGIPTLQWSEITCELRMWAYKSTELVSGEVFHNFGYIVIYNTAEGWGKIVRD